MPVIKVWCLPKMTEEQLNKLHKDIVAEVVSVKELGLKNENDMTCLFPPDSMEKGLGEEVIIEVTGLFESPERTPDVRFQLALQLADIVYETVPKVLYVECFIYPFNPEYGYSTRGAVPGSALFFPKL